jgi:hypothetical protein
MIHLPDRPHSTTVPITEGNSDMYSFHWHRICCNLICNFSLRKLNQKSVSIISGTGTAICTTVVVARCKGRW